MVQLDKYQENVVNSPRYDNLRVIGAPGSGKTRTLTTRYANLCINMGVEPSRILAVTFSKKAADEMYKRVSKMVDLDITAKNQISTINAFCYRTYNAWRKDIGLSPLKVWQYGNKAENPSFKAAELMQEYLKTSDLSMFDLINKTLKSEPEPSISLLESIDIKGQKANNAMTMWIEYERWMKNNGLVDFYGQVWNIDRLLHKNPVFNMVTGRMFDKILADETQDMFPQTYRILLKLAEKSSIELYGDPSQSIYGFNGAAPNLFYEVENSIPNLVTHHLSNNYRSVNSIVSVVNDFGPKTSERFSDMICAKVDDTGGVKIRQVEHIGEQAACIAAETHRLRSLGYDYGDMYVLARTNAQCSMIYQHLLQLAIPANYASNFSIWNRTHIKAGISYMAIVKGQDTQDDLGNVLNIPSEDYVNVYGVNQGRYSPTRFLTRNVFSFPFSHLTEKYTPTRPQRPGVSNLIKFIDKLKGLDNDRQRVADIGSAISKWAQWSGKDYHEIEDDLAMLWDKLENLDYSVNDFRIYIQKLMEAKRKIKPGSKKVEVMTIHQAKGLESPIVFLTGLSEPTGGEYQKSGFHPGRNRNLLINEENCLYYVGISRAIKYLYLIGYKISGGITYELSSFVTSKAKEIAKYNGSIQQK